NSTIVPMIHGKSSAKSTSTVAIFGTKVSVWSLICVAVCSTEMARPTPSAPSSTGAITHRLVRIVSWRRAVASSTVIARSPDAAHERADDQVPAVDQHEEHELEGQRDDHRRQHDHLHGDQHR